MLDPAEIRDDGVILDAPQLRREVVPVFPLPGTVLLPGELLPLHVFEPRYRDLTRDALAGDRLMGVVAIRPGHESEAAGQPPLAEVGCLGFIAQHSELPDGRYLLWLVGLEAFRIDQELPQEASYRQVRVDYLPSGESADEQARVAPLRRELLSQLPDLLDTDDATRAEMLSNLGGATDSQLVALACHALELEPRRKQDLLESTSLLGRYTMVFEGLYARLGEGLVAGVAPELLN